MMKFQFISRKKPVGLFFWTGGVDDAVQIFRFSATPDLVSEDIAYTWDVELEDDVELIEFSDEIEDWVISEFKKIGIDTAKGVLDKELSELLSRTDLEEETILEVKKILKEEFEE